MISEQNNTNDQIEQRQDDNRSRVNFRRDGGHILTRNLIAFWLLGLCNNFGYVVMLSAAKDILERSTSQNESSQCIEDTRDLKCSPISTGAVLLADILPSLCIKLAAPWTFYRIPFKSRHALILVTQTFSFLTVALSSTLSVGLLGVIFASFGAGLGEVTYLSLSSYFHNDAVSAWSSGTGGAGIFGALAFAVLTDTRLLAFSPRNALLAMLLVPMLMLFTYWRVLHSPVGVRCQSWTPNGGSAGAADNNTSIGAVSTDGDRSEDDDRRSLLSTSSGESDSLSPMKRVRNIRRLLRFMVPLAFVYFTEYLINQGLLELVVFDCAHSFHMSPGSQYRWFQVLYQVGVFLSRSSVKLFPVPATLLPLLALLQAGNAIFLFEESMRLQIPHLVVAMVLVLYEGLLGGLAYVNTFSALHRSFSKTQREFAMAFVSLSDSLGIVCAGFAAIQAHNFICMHR